MKKSTRTLISLIIVVVALSLIITKGKKEEHAKEDYRQRERVPHHTKREEPKAVTKPQKNLLTPPPTPSQPPHTLTDAQQPEQESAFPISLTTFFIGVSLCVVASIILKHFNNQNNNKSTKQQSTRNKQGQNQPNQSITPTTTESSQHNPNKPATAIEDSDASKKNDEFKESDKQEQQTKIKGKYEKRVEDLFNTTGVSGTKLSGLANNPFKQGSPANILFNEEGWDKLKQSMQGTYQMIHPEVVPLVKDFIRIKRQHGTDREKAFYKNVSVAAFFHRIATKRCLYFYGSSDTLLTQKGKTTKHNNYRNFALENIKNNLTYDELLISALCGISSPTYFFNNGERHNNGKKREDFTPKKAIYMGLIGARFEKYQKPTEMEYRYLVIDKMQNTKANGYGKNNTYNHTDKRAHVNFMAKLVGRDYLPTFDEVQAIETQSQNDKTIKQERNDYYFDRYCKTKHPTSEEWIYLDLDAFQKRLSYSIELFLLEANKKAKKRIDGLDLGNLSDKDIRTQYGAYCYGVGLGLGVWGITTGGKVESKVLIETVKACIKKLDLPYVSKINFTWMNTSEENVIKDCKNHEIKFLVSRSYEEGGKGPGEDNFHKNTVQNRLLVAMYAWDSNAFPGNEYYEGKLNASGDPAAASCSLISFTQNAAVNTEYVNGPESVVFDKDFQRLEKVEGTMTTVPEKSS